MLIIEDYSIVKEFKSDAMFASPGGSTRKGTSTDIMNRQSIAKPPKLSKEELTDLYRQSRLVQNIVDIFAEDCTRAWVEFEDCSDAFVDAITLKLNNLQAPQEFQNMISFERLYGDGFIAMGITAAQKNNVNKPIPDNKIVDIEYLNAFSSKVVEDIFMNLNPFYPDYNRASAIKMRNTSSLVGIEGTRVDASRFIHLQTRKIEEEKWGISIIDSILDGLQVFDNGFWSLGQVLYELTFKVLKSDAIKSIAESLNITQAELQQKIQRTMETNSLSIIGSKEDLKRISQSIPGIKDIFEVIWEVIAMYARMPKSILMGQQRGTLSGAEYDTLAYYGRIAGFQENWLRQHIERVINLLKKATNSDVPDEEYTMKFAPLWQLNRETDAKIRKMVAETYKIYTDMQALTGREVREFNFELESLPEMLDMDEEELKKLAKEVNEAHEGDDHEEE